LLVLVEMQMLLLLATSDPPTKTLVVLLLSHQMDWYPSLPAIAVAELEQVTWKDLAVCNDPASPRDA
jgi:hypothetical protein